jgi:ATP-dependent Clp protease ATP-binding subunit ClpA
LSGPLYGAEVVGAVQRAHDVSLTYRHPDAGTSHLLFALLEDDTGRGATLLRDLGADPAGLRDRIEQELRLAPAWGG